MRQVSLGSDGEKQERLTQDRQAVLFKMNICGTPPADALIEADLPGVVKLVNLLT